jgi:Ring finger domain
MNTMNPGMDLDEAMISVSPICKPTAPNNNKSTTGDSFIDGTSSPPSVFGNGGAPPSAAASRATLQHQHSYAGHEENLTDHHTVGSVPRAPSGRPFLATRHLSIGETATTVHDSEESPILPNNDSPPSWSHHPRRTTQERQRLFQSDSPQQSPGSFSAAADQRRQEEETPEERARREEEESIALAQMLMAEEAMASHRMSADFLRLNSEQFSAEDFAALQDALREEEDYDDEADEVEEDMSYDALLRLGERIGDVKTDRWTMIAHKEIAKLETFQYDPSVHTKDGDDEDAQMEDIDDSELKCLVCQFTYEKGDQLRRLPCGHCFHKDCVDQWLQTKDCCAYCRQSILPNQGN